MSHPPKNAQRLLKWFSGRAEMEDIQGDLDELYYFHLETRPKRKADLFYWKHVLSLLFSYSLKKRKQAAAYAPYYPQNSFAMIRNYFKIALRNFSKHKLFTSLNIFGLALGMCICLLALSIAVAIYQSDEFHTNKDRIYQVNTYIATETESKTYGSIFPATAHNLHTSYPFIEDLVNIHGDIRPTISHYGSEIGTVGYFTTPSFFHVFDFEMVIGNPRSALEDPYSMVLTQSLAEKLFKDLNPIGEIINTDYGDFKVTGVMADPKQTHLFFEALFSYATYKELNEHDLKNDWVNFRNNYAYVLLSEGTGEEQLSQALADLDELAREFHGDSQIKFSSVKLTDAVPRWNISNAIGIGWDQPSIIFFLSIGFLVLLPAIFNYTNLSIARALQRAKEVGIRKTVGAEKNQIKSQFIVETILMTMIALVLSLIIMNPLKTEFLGMVWAAQVLDTDLNTYQLLTFLIFTLLVGFLAGIFPAQYFSRLNPIQTLKGDLRNGKSNVSDFKKGLFVFQFFVSLVFIIGVVAIGRQYRYVLHRNHGFETDNVISVPFKGLDQKVLLTEFSHHPNVKNVTSSSSLPGLPIIDKTEATSNGRDTITLKQVFIDDDFIAHTGMQLIWGDDKNMTQSNQTEELVVVNKAYLDAIRVFNTQEDSLRFTLADGTNCRIVGILEDFNFEPLNEVIRPIALRNAEEKTRYALLTIHSDHIQRTIAELDEVWTSIDDKVNFEAKFLEDDIEEAYYFIAVQIKFFSVLSALAITISCLGLLGMVVYNTENRTKEIAIRKIMGATERSLYLLLSKDFIKLIGIAAAIALPFSYFFYDKLFLYFLLRYGTGLGVLEMMGSVFFLFLVGAICILWQTSKVAKSNPVNRLRYE